MMIPGTFTLLVGLMPVVGYLLMLSVVRASGRALVTSGGRDIAALGLAMAGLFAVGPAQLFFPEAAGTIFGPTVWIFLLVFYGLCVSLTALTSPPKLVIYGRTPAEAYPLLLAACRRIDPGVTGTPNLLKVEFPESGLSLRVEGFRGIDYAQVIAFEPGVTHEFWDALLGHLRSEARSTRTPLFRSGTVFAAIAGALGVYLVWRGLNEPSQVVEGFRQWMWRQ